jgi:glycosyltransferase involved in cell wall biosynthesis
LCEAIATHSSSPDCVVVAVNDRSNTYHYPPRVHIEVDQHDADSYAIAADRLNETGADVLCIQHEFGIYGGPAGAHLLGFLDVARMPVVTTLHTVLPEPDEYQRRVMVAIIERSSRLVVMAEKAAEILINNYGVDGRQIDIVPHGIPDVSFETSAPFKEELGLSGRSVLLTYGLLGPGKGIEHAIRAMPEIIERHPEALYVILGATHPNLLEREGEAYRESLEDLADGLGVRGHMSFENRFVTLEELGRFIGATDVYLTPYLNEAQITSGTLAHVFGAGRAIVSTPYWHARELLGDGLGVLVPFRNSTAIADGVCGLLEEPERADIMRIRAYERSRSCVWPEVAVQYMRIFDQVEEMSDHVNLHRVETMSLGLMPEIFSGLKIDHLKRLTDDTGILQHAIYNVPNYREGYCTDDNARAFILCNRIESYFPGRLMPEIDQLATRYLAFLAAALDETTGRFRNFMNHERRWLEPFGSEDSHGRAVWAVGMGASRSADSGRRKLSAQLFENSITAVNGFTSPRAWAFALLGIHEYGQTVAKFNRFHSICESLSEKLLGLWHACSAPNWPWFESNVTYENARICQALIVTGETLSDERSLGIGFSSLEWLCAQHRMDDGCFQPTGTNGFHHRDGERAVFDQQPVEAQAMVSACIEAFRVSGDEAWLYEANRAFKWFLGANELGIPLHDEVSGGCRDGLHCDRVNENQGAESTLAFLIAATEIAAAQRPLSHIHAS